MEQNSVENAASFLWAAAIFWIFGRYALRVFLTITGRLFGFYSHQFYSKFLGIIGWRTFYYPLLRLRVWYEGFRIGGRANAQWATLPEMMYYVYRRGDLFLGRLQAFNIPLYQPVSIRGSEKHLCVFSQTGGGKSTYLATLLAEYISGKHSPNAFVVDVDGQIFNALHRRLGTGGNGVIGKGKDVFILDPYKLSNGKTASWNPVEEIDAAVKRHGEDAAVSTAHKLAEALIKRLDERNTWVYNSGRQFCHAVLLYIWAYEVPENHNLIRFRELVTIGLRGVTDEKYNPFDVLLYEMKQKTDKFGGIIAKGAEMMEASQRGDGGNPVRSDIMQQTGFLDFPEIQTICRTSDFNCEDLKVGKTSVFIACPITEIQGALSGWVRALTMMTMHSFQTIRQRPKEPSLFLIDETPSLKIEDLPTFAAVFRKFGGRLITVSQNLERLRDCYPSLWSSFLGDAEATVWLGNDHKETLIYLSGILGKQTRSETVKPTFWRRLRRKEKSHTTQVERDLASPQQLREFLNNNVIVTRSGHRPMKLKPDPYFKALPVYFHEPDAFYGEKPLRRLTRSVCRRIEKELPVFRNRLEEQKVKTLKAIKSYKTKKVKFLSGK